MRKMIQKLTTAIVTLALAFGSVVPSVAMAAGTTETEILTLQADKTQVAPAGNETHDSGTRCIAQKPKPEDNNMLFFQRFCLALTKYTNGIKHQRQRDGNNGQNQLCIHNFLLFCEFYQYIIIPTFD